MEDKYTYYPVCIPTLCRYEHFKKCVESLANNTHADKTELVIGLDYPPSEKYREGYLKIKNFIPCIKGFSKVTVFERESNWGTVKNFKNLKEYAFEKYDAIIISEDDNEFSPCFLDFMDKALNKYKNDYRISSVQGYNDTFFYLQKNNIIFLPSGGAWGLGLWRDKKDLVDMSPTLALKMLNSFSNSWKIFRTCPPLLSMLISMHKEGRIYGDVLLSCQNIINDRYQLMPSVSMVRNLGHDGTGVHCTVDNSYAEQIIQKGEIFNMDDVEPEVTPEMRKLQFYSLLSKNKIVAWAQVLKVGIKYLLYYAISLKNRIRGKTIVIWL